MIYPTPSKLHIFREPELERYRQNAPHLPGPGDARQVEEYVFQKCSSEHEYRIMIAKIVYAINCDSHTAAVPNVLGPNFRQSNNQLDTEIVKALRDLNLGMKKR